MLKTILGIDPGSRITGFGVIRSNGIRHQYITSGCIRLTGKDLAQRLLEIYENIGKIITLHQPDEAAIEQIFLHKNPNSALKLGHARGVAIVAISQHILPVAEYATRQIKQAVVGYGNASKLQIQQMIKTTLKLSGLPQADAADALAVAICHAQMQSGLSALTKTKTLRRGRLR
jgi:crossover junction endodeoxyribonuclease RuvC